MAGTLLCIIKLIEMTEIPCGRSVGSHRNLLPIHFIWLNELL